MRLSKSLLLIPAASFLFAAAVGSGACSSSSGAVIAFPDGSAPLTTALPTGIPSTCSGQTYWVANDPAICATGPAYFLCDGSSYSDYDCKNPGAGWSDASGNTPPTGFSSPSSSVVTTSATKGPSSSTSTGVATSGVTTSSFTPPPTSGSTGPTSSTGSTSTSGGGTSTTNQTSTTGGTTGPTGNGSSSISESSSFSSFSEGTPSISETFSSTESTFGTFTSSVSETFSSTVTVSETNTSAVSETFTSSVGETVTSSFSEPTVSSTSESFATSSETFSTATETFSTATETFSTATETFTTTEAGTTTTTEPPASSSSSVATGPQQGKVIFLANFSAVSGDFSTTSAAGGHTGIPGADAICAAAAQNSQQFTTGGVTFPSLVGRSFKAWVSDASTDPLNPVSPNTRFTKTTGYTLVDGTPIADTYDDLTNAANVDLLNSINESEDGDVITAEPVWTGTDPQGNPTGNDCNGWSTSSAAVTGDQGNIFFKDGTWTDFQTVGCDANGGASPAMIICVEQ